MNFLIQIKSIKDEKMIDNNCIRVTHSIVFSLKLSKIILQGTPTITIDGPLCPTVIPAPSLYTNFRFPLIWAFFYQNNARFFLYNI